MKHRLFINGGLWRSLKGIVCCAVVPLAILVEVICIREFVKKACRRFGFRWVEEEREGPSLTISEGTYLEKQGGMPFQQGVLAMDVKAKSDEYNKPLDFVSQDCS